MRHSFDKWYSIIYFTVLWTIATTAGWLLWFFGITLFLPVSWLLGALCGEIPGVTIGLAQWWLLRRYLPDAVAWLLGILPGTMLSWFAILNRTALQTDVILVENGAIIGLIMGIGQAMVLAHWTKIRWHRLVWILNSIASWAISWLVYGQGHMAGFESFTAAIALAGAVSGLTTGPALIMLLIQSGTPSKQIV